MDDPGLTKKQQAILEQFKKNIEDIMKPEYDDRYLLRWLRARDFDLKKAEAMLREHLKFRKKIGLDNLLETFKLRKETERFVITKFLGFDNEGHMVRFCNAGTCDPKGGLRAFTYMEILKYGCQAMEWDFKMQKEHNKKTGKSVDTVTYIGDFSGLRYHQWMSKDVIELVLHLSKLYQDHYPETLHIAYGLNVPSFVASFYNNVLKPFLAEAIVSKLRIYGTNDDSYKEELFSLVPKEIVPAYLGGDRYDPEGDPKCSDLLNWYTEVPPSLYLRDRSSLLMEEPDASEVNIKERGYFELERFANDPGDVLSWKFETRAYDIKFGLFYEGTQKTYDSAKNDREVVIPLQRIDCHLIVEYGKHVCRKSGRYVLLFDNSYSMFHSKCLLYKVRVVPAAMSSATG